MKTSKARNPKWNICEHCREGFPTYPHEVRRFCSFNCFKFSHQRTEKCPICGKERVLQKLARRKGFCSYKCASLGHRKHPEKVCPHCGVVFRRPKANARFCSKDCFDKYKTLPREEFWRRWKLRVKEYRHKHPEKTAAWKQKRRALELGAPGHFTAEEFVEMKKKLQHRCAICKKKAKLTVDHIIPLSRGGSNHIENIQPLCMPCNSRKSVKI